MAIGIWGTAHEQGEHGALRQTKKEKTTTNKAPINSSAHILNKTNKYYF
jgi:hypothetical protein